MTAKQIAQDLQALNAASQSGFAAIHGDQLPSPLDQRVTLESSTAIGPTLLLSFENGALITMFEPKGFSCDLNIFQILQAEFIRLESHRLKDYNFLWEYTCKSGNPQRAVNDGQFSLYGNGSPALTFGKNAG